MINLRRFQNEEGTAFYNSSNSGWVNSDSINESARSKQ